MTTHTTHEHGRDTVVIIGGKGGLESRYREAVEQYGYDFRYYEARVPAKRVPTQSKIAMVIVMVTMISHPLLAQARAIAGEHGRLVYLKSPSISAVRQTVATAAAPLTVTSDV